MPNTLSFALRAVVVLVAALEAGAIALFVAFAFSGDTWGIARAVALLLALPFAALTIPALVLIQTGGPRAAAWLAAFSLAGDVPFVVASIEFRDSSAGSATGRG